MKSIKFNSPLRQIILGFALICFSSSLAFGQKNTMNLVVPAYIYPGDNAANWSDLLAAANILGSRLVVIANPGSGPGPGCNMAVPPQNCACIDANLQETEIVNGVSQQYNVRQRCQDIFDDYSYAINQLQSRGARVIGYIPLGFNNGSVTFVDVMYDRLNWYYWYELDGLFFDEADFGGWEGYSYAQQYGSTWHLVNEPVGGGPGDPNVTESGDPFVIFNPGKMPDDAEAWTKHNHGGMICNFEQKAEYWNNTNYPNHQITGITPFQKGRSVVLLHEQNASNWSQRLDDIYNAGFRYFYLTDDVQVLNNAGVEIASPWDALPSFFEEMVNEIR